MRRLQVIVPLLLLAVLTISWTTFPPADKKGKQRQPSDKRVEIRHADLLYHDVAKHPTAQFLVGNVSLEHNGSELFCDSAMYFETTNSFNAFGRVRMLQGDTLSLHCDALYYNGVDEQAQARQNVVLKNRGMTLYTDTLDYDKQMQLGYFQEGGRLVDNKNELVSDWGEYNLNTHDATFYYNVTLRSPASNPRTILKTDSLYYNTHTEVAHIVGPSNIDSRGDHIYSENGWYNSKTEISLLLDRSSMINAAKTKSIIGDSLWYNSKTKQARAFGDVEYVEYDEGKNRACRMYCDSVYYEEGKKDTKAYGRVKYVDVMEKREMICDRVVHNDETKVTEGFGNVEYTDFYEKKHMTGDHVYHDDVNKITNGYGNVIFVDSLNKARFEGQYAHYNELTGYSEAAGDPFLTDYSQRDTLWARADSFRVYTYNIDTDSVYRVGHAIHHVRAFRVDVQAVCDSAVYSTLDSCFYMYKDPIVWQGEQQLLGEEIRAWMNDSTLDSCYIMRQALSVERIDTLHYNQIAADEIRTYFCPNGDPDYTVAWNNVYVNYYPFDDDSLMIGMNHTETSELRIFMKDRRVRKIWMPAAEGDLYPLGLVPPDKLYLQNFAWFDYVRPKRKEDIFIWVPKNEDKQLKESIRHEAPRQRLEDIK